jgi:hypothetical protein
MIFLLEQASQGSPNEARPASNENVHFPPSLDISTVPFAS